MKKLSQIVISIILLAAYITDVHAQEEKFISMYLYNFTKYVEWPSQSRGGDFIIDVIGHKSVYTNLKDLAESKTVGHQNIVVRNFETVDEISKCHILFIGHWKSRYFKEIMKKMEGHNTLIITEKDGLINLGSAINFVINDGVIKFELKAANATKYGLRINSKLQHIAHAYYD